VHNGIALDGEGWIAIVDGIEGNAGNVLSAPRGAKNLIPFLCFSDKGE
jgi:hypothetical protein